MSDGFKVQRFHILRFRMLISVTIGGFIDRAVSLAEGHVAMNNNTSIRDQTTTGTSGFTRVRVRLALRCVQFLRAVSRGCSRNDSACTTPGRVGARLCGRVQTLKDSGSQSRRLQHKTQSRAARAAGAAKRARCRRLTALRAGELLRR